MSSTIGDSTTALSTPPPYCISSPAATTIVTTSSSSGRTSTSSSSDEIFENPFSEKLNPNSNLNPSKIPRSPLSCSFSRPYKQLAVLSGHVGPVSCLALCGEFVLSASQGRDIIVWQQPDLRRFAQFGFGSGSVKALVSYGNKVLTAHQDTKIRVWKVSKSSENVFKLVETLPTTKDYLGKFMKQSNYVQTRRNHKRLWIEHADTISCLAVSNGLVYSGSWDKTLKVWRLSDFGCIESIQAHDDAINGLVARSGSVYSSSADGKIKVWGKEGKNDGHSLRAVLEGRKDVSLNSVAVSEDGRFVYGGCSDGFIMGWSGNEGLNRWKLVCEIKGHKMAVLCVCLMGEGDRFLCSGSADSSVCIWSREKLGGGLARHLVIRGHEGPVKCMRAGPSRVGGGFLLYSGSVDRSVRVWWVPGDSEKDLDLVRVK